jgi:hypothetical protein
MAWIQRLDGAQFRPDGTVLVPTPAGAAAVRHAQEVLAAWAEL